MFRSSIRTLWPCRHGRKRDIIVWDEAGVHMVDLALIQEITLKVEESRRRPAEGEAQMIDSRAGELDYLCRTSTR